MKALIAITCAVVITAGGVFLYGEIAAHNAREKIAAVEAELFQMAKAKPDERDKVKAMCAGVESRIAAGGPLAGNGMARQLVTNCRGLGYL